MNKMIVGAAFLIVAAGVVNAVQQGQPTTPVFVGAYIFLLALGIVDLFGPPFSTLATSFAMIAALYVVIREVPWTQLLGNFGLRTGGQGGTGNTPTTAGTQQYNTGSTSPIRSTSGTTYTQFTP